MNEVFVEEQGSHCDHWVDHQFGGRTFIRLIPVLRSDGDNPGNFVPQGYQDAIPVGWRYATPLTAVGPFGPNSIPMRGYISPAFNTMEEALKHGAKNEGAWRLWKAPPEARRPGWVGNQHVERVPLYVRPTNSPESHLTLWGFARKGKKGEVIILLDTNFSGRVVEDDDPVQTKWCHRKVWQLAEDFLR